MKVLVDLNRCQGYAQCVYAAPAVFQLQGEEILIYDHAPSDALLLNIDQAVNACPVRAIVAVADGPEAERHA